MKQSCVLQTLGRTLVPGSNILRRDTFKAMDTRGYCALLGRENHLLAFGFSGSRDKSALFREKDCFDCQSPHRAAV